MQQDAFLVHARLGSGTTGAVFRASRAADGRQLVLKSLHPEFVRAVDMDHFAEVVAAIGQVDHHGVAAHVELVEWRGETVLARQYIRGVDLATVVAGSAPPQKIALEIVSEIAGALAAVLDATGHRHGDLKPSNVFIDQQGDVKLVDFGMGQPVPDGADRTLTMFHGSVGFMSPERADNQQSDTSDVYSLGLILAWMLTGEMPRRTSANPRRHGEQQELLLDRVKANGAPVGAVELIAECTAYRPEARPAMADVARRLALLAGQASGPPVLTWAGPLVDALVGQPNELEVSDVGQPLSRTADVAPIREASALGEGQAVKRIDTGAHKLARKARSNRVKPVLVALGFIAALMSAAMLAAAVAIATGA